MTGLYALYENGEAAGRAVGRLRAAGLRESEITILSSEPLDRYEFGQTDSDTVMPWVALSGGLVGLATGLVLTALTQLDWPIVTGGMPIVSILPNLIPTFELTMLGAVLATVGVFGVTALWPGSRSLIYDPAVSEGKILVGVESVDDARSADVEQALGKEGELKRFR